MSIFKLSLKIVAAHRLQIFIYLVLLSMLSVFIGISSTLDSPEDVAQVPVRVAVLDRDNSVVSRGISEHLRRVGQPQPLKDTPRAIQDASAEDRIHYILIIPAGFGASLEEAAHHQADLPQLETVINYRSAYGALADTKVNSYVDQIYEYLGVAGWSAEQAVKLADEAMSHSATAEVIVQGAERPSLGFTYYASFATYPIFAYAVVAIATLMASVRREAVRSRTTASPTSDTVQSVGLLGACVVVGLIGWAWILTVGLAFFALGQPGTTAPPIAMVALALFSYTLVSVAVGFLLGQLGLSENAATVVANLGSMALSLLAGAWMPVDNLPSAVAAVAKFTPGYWVNNAIEGVREITVVSADSLMPLAGDCAVAMLFAIAIFVVGIAIGHSRARSSL